MNQPTVLPEHYLTAADAAALVARKEDPRLVRLHEALGAMFKEIRRTATYGGRSSCFRIPPDISSDAMEYLESLGFRVRSDADSINGSPYLKIVVAWRET